MVSSGKVLKSGFVYGQGSVLGKDFILDSQELIDPSPSQALSFLELGVLTRVALNKVIAVANPNDRKALRRFQIKTAIAKKLLQIGGREHYWKPHGPCMVMFATQCTTSC